MRARRICSRSLTVGTEGPAHRSAAATIRNPRSSPLLPLLRFHFAVGVRLAMRLLLPLITAAFGAGMLLGTDFLTSFSRVLFGARSSGGTSVLIAALFLGTAAEAAPRICR